MNFCYSCIDGNRGRLSQVTAEIRWHRRPLALRHQIRSVRIHRQSASRLSFFIEERKSSFALSPVLSTLHRSTSKFHCLSSFTLSDIANVPQQFTTTLAQPIPSSHSQSSRQIHSPNDVVAKLLQSFHPKSNKAHGHRKHERVRIRNALGSQSSPSR